MLGCECLFIRADHDNSIDLKPAIRLITFPKDIHLKGSSQRQRKVTIVISQGLFLSLLSFYQKSIMLSGRQDDP